MDSSKETFKLFDKTGKHLLTEQTFLSSGCPLIDIFLRGGFFKRGITQIYGQAGTGKSQIALQLCLSVQQIKDEVGNPYGAVYICTEAVFPAQRLKQLLANSQLCQQHLVSTDRIFIEHIDTVNNLETFLNAKLPVLLERFKIGVIIIDSIAAPFTVEYEQDELRNRALSLRKISSRLHNISRTHDLSVVCLNQVRSDLSSGDSEVPALGITWEQAITNSIYLYRNNSKRFARVVSSPYLPKKVMEFEVNNSGVSGIKMF